MDQKSVIERIRNVTYKVGDDSANGLKEELNSALELLSKELYAKDTHFVLELIQNADDNIYDDGVIPEIKFKLESQVLVVRNNEKGFATENVDSICRAGKSTKKKEKKQGYIGEKGIGFKSVFKVSDAPQIHSNGFHFNFKTADKDDVLGFVVPHWIENPPTWYTGAGTTIVLPAKIDKPYDKKLYENLKPELLLFLRRLRAVKIETDLDGVSIDFSRKDQAEIVTIESRERKQQVITEKTENYKIARYLADVSDIKVNEREGFETSEIILAFPVTHEGLPQIKDSRYVFAFLPIKEYGLKFVLQADLLLTTSREEIQGENKWNERLLAEIPSAFVQQALPLFKQDPKLKSTYYSYLESARLDEIFKSVMKAVFNELSETDCILTIENNWRTPYDALIGDVSSKEIVNNQDLINLLGKEYVSQELHVFRNTLENLGCEDFVVENMIECLKHEDWVKKHLNNPTWFCKLFGYLSLKAKSEALIEEIKNLKIIPVTSGGVMSAKNGNIFLPFNKTTYGFEESLEMLEKTVLPAEDTSSRLRVIEFLNKLGIVDAVPRVIIDTHIIPVHQNNKGNINKQAYIGHIRYIKDNIKNYIDTGLGLSSGTNSDLSKLGTKLLVLTTDESTFELASRLYLGRDYRNTNDLEKLFSGYENIKYISSEYMIDPKDPDECASWFDFFKTIRAGYIPRLSIVKPKSAVLGVNKHSTRPIDTVDYALTQDLQKLFSEENREKKNMLLALLARNWSSYYGSYTKAKVTGYHYSEWIERPLSTFTKLVKTLSVPVTAGGWRELQKAYIDNNDIRACFGNDLYFLEADVASYTSFLDDVNVRYKVTVPAVLERLLSLSEGNGAPTREMLARLYNIIEVTPHEKPREITNFFSNHRVIFLQKNDNHWFKSADVCWKEPSSKIISSRYPSLRVEYREHETFFTKVINVKEQLEADQLIEVLSDLENDQSDNTDKAEAAQKIYLELEDFLKEAEKNEDDQPEWVEQFLEDPLLWTLKNELHRNMDSVFLNDIPSIGKLFMARDGFTFLHVEHNHIPRLERFVKLNKIEPLSRVLSKNISSGTEKKFLKNVSVNLNERWRHIARFLYSHYYRSFERLVADGRLVQLSLAEVFSVENLQLRLSLKGEEATANFKCAMVDGSILIDQSISLDLDRLYYEVSMEIAKTLDVEGSSAFINLILVAASQEMIDLRVKDLKELPDEIEQMLVGKFKADQFETNADDSFPEITEHETISATSIISPSVQEDHLRTSVAKPPEEITQPENIVTAIYDEILPAPSVTESIGLHESLEGRPHEYEYIQEASSDTSGIGPSVDMQPSFIPPRVENETIGTTKPKGDAVTKEGLTSSGREVVGGKFNGTMTIDKIKKRKGRGISYAGNDLPSDDDHKDPQRRERNMAISNAAVAIVKAAEQKDGFVIDFVAEGDDHNNPGYDVHSTKNTDERYIEIKGTDGPWTDYGVSVSPAQIHWAKINKEKFWLYVVEYAGTPQAKLYRIQNIYEKITEFRFDSGWKSFAIETDDKSTQELVPQNEMRVTLKMLNQSGEIIKVKRHGNGKFCKLWIALDTGKTLADILYNPATMTLEDK